MIVHQLIFSSFRKGSKLLLTDVSTGRLQIQQCVSKQLNSAPSSETNCYAFKAIHIYIILDTLVFATFHVNVFIN